MSARLYGAKAPCNPNKVMWLTSHTGWPREGHYRDRKAIHPHYCDQVHLVKRCTVV